MNVSKTFQRAIKIELNGFKMQYFGYSKSDAKKKFKEDYNKHLNK